MNALIPFIMKNREAGYPICAVKMVNKKILLESGNH
jgi:hypothetical protein